MKNKQTKKGFTLVELIVVIAVLGILAAIAVPRLGKFRADALVKAHNANVKTLENAAAMYIAEKGNPDAQETVDSKNKNFDEYLQKWPTVPKGLKNVTEKEYTVKIAADGKITVTPELIAGDAGNTTPEQPNE